MKGAIVAPMQSHTSTTEGIIMEFEKFKEYVKDAVTDPWATGYDGNIDPDMIAQLLWNDIKEHMKPERQASLSHLFEMPYGK